MSVSTLVSRITGFVRTWAMAYALGVTAIADSYDIANNLPNMLFELLAGGVLSSVFIPLFMERMQRDGEHDAWRFASYVLNIMVLALGAVALIATVWPDPFVRSQTLTVPAEQAALAIWFFRFFAVQIVFYGMGLVFTGVLNSYRRFLAPAIAPIFNNLVVTITLLGFYVPLRESDPDLALTALAVGTTLGIVVMAAVQVPSLARLGWRHTLRIDWHHPGLRTIAAKTVPILIYVVTNLVAVTFRTNFAIATGEGGQAALRYAWQFYQLPYGIFAVALATAIFPELAERGNAGDIPGFRAMFARGLRATTVLIVPLAALLATLATPVITLYRAGRFTAEDIPVVAGVLTWWAIGLIFFAGYMYVLKSFYSLQDTKTPMYTNIAATSVHVLLYAVLTRGFGAWEGLGITGIPIADGIFFLGHLAVLLLILRIRIGGIEGRSVAVTFIKTAAASTAGAAVAWVVMRATAALDTMSGGFIAQLLIAGTAGLLTSYGAMTILGVPELAAFARRLRERFGRRS
ncbi:MAG: murein biosynthesis integral membrane protein MurJ [Coriobacteriia bacterium]|nr:murein biosynthesis integral membrane protein MurJ [Coriobacteriia bacterium]MBN2847525.1 murein biosynthesis integral membrane protein MurJ [Coriobacteriia bacterium]